MPTPNPSQLPYVDLTELKAYLNISDTDANQDVFLTNVIKQTQRFIERYTGRTFGWGDQDSSAAGASFLYDSEYVDYSNSDNIGISSAPTLNGHLLTINTQGPVPWIVGENVSLFGMTNPAWNGVWAVNAVNSAVQIVVDVGTSKGALGLGYQQTITNNPTGTANGYVGNAVSNYRYISQEQHDGLVGKTIYLRNMDVRSVDTLYIGLRNIAQPVLLDHTQFVWRNDGRIILGGAYFNSFDSSIYSASNDNAFYGTVAAGYQTITVSYWCGYTGVPEDVSLAALDIAANMYVLRKSLGMQEERIGDYLVRYDLEFRKQLQRQPDSLNTLNTLRRHHL